ncbi:alanine racemase [Antarcticirhabdus aurantiaca]|uniref:Alanine racemase n=1 Tax=Antarcticirhabdus aurantiaca TaxID=2606717 RepID=A0ACD4NHM8_9HYPH|nr:alanine racemase [Antarcticirhabdus aurantiaca]WAJ26319.1 alanine racemase [Jeongeuplla avenae]
MSALAKAVPASGPRIGGGASAPRADASGAAAGGVLTIDLSALRANYRLLRQRVGGAAVAGVVKANAYGLGAERVAPALWDEGCRTFFVAHLGEALALRPVLPADAEIFVLNGLAPGDERLCADARVRPVLNALDQVRAWGAEGRRRGGRLPAAIQVDSGMSRLGLAADEVESLVRDPSRLAGVETVLVMSHLACADDPDHPANAAQLAAFRAMEAKLPAARRSLANSAGLFLGPDFRFDLARPGVALYGGAPTGGAANPMRPVVRLDGRVIQTREVPAGAGIGYGFTRVADGPMRLATLGLGYADGWPRALSNRLAGFVAGRRLPVVGRVSMDSLILDASALPAGALKGGDLIELIGPSQSLDAVAEAAGTISYEILTSLGHRYERRYLC